MNELALATKVSFLPRSTGVWNSGRSRIEKDSLGASEIPAEMYWGIHTLRALQNFPLTGTQISSYPALVTALVHIKHAAILANFDLGLIDEAKKDAIVQACREIEQGDLRDQFVVDVIQGGAGTATNMNVNEVIANRALELLGHHRGAYSVIHPNRDLNAGQSTRDDYATALKIAVIQTAYSLLSAMEYLRDSLARKAVELGDIVATGLTNAGDTPPLVLGQEFNVYAAIVEEAEHRIREGLIHLHEIDLGGPSTGVGMDTHPAYASRVLTQLQQITDLPLKAAGDLREATRDGAAFVFFSGSLKLSALGLLEICSRLQFLSSERGAGTSAVNVPPRQANSTMTPGKADAVIPEAVTQIAFKVIGNDFTITMAAEAGQLQRRTFEPIIAQSLLASLTYLTSACTTLAEQCIGGITT
jgi:aspartate ammonia-lyase